MTGMKSFAIQMGRLLQTNTPSVRFAMFINVSFTELLIFHSEFKVWKTNVITLALIVNIHEKRQQRHYPTHQKSLAGCILHINRHQQWSDLLTLVNYLQLTISYSSTEIRSSHTHQLPAAYLILLINRHPIFSHLSTTCSLPYPAHQLTKHYVGGE